ncbi:MAG TPA: sigma 54-interacting transcriptional regulator [Thermoanaerobaculia bacterium]|nr:sigma 54-interacting transcriptional regulator [Thermoanaerobaculia bacterium]
MHLTDRQRVAVLLQAAALLSLLAQAGHRLAGWDEARVAPGGLLRVDGLGGPGRPAQDLLLELTALLFGDFGEGLVAGRGEGRRAMRALLADWRQSLVPLAPDEAVRQILDAAPFLWQPDQAVARRALAGEPGPGRLWVAGPRSFRARLLGRGRSLAGLADLLAGPEARSLWNLEEEGTPGELAAAGRWRAAVAAWERRPPESGEERVERAAALVALGRFEMALEGLAGLSSPTARTLAARCQLDLGELGAARATLRGLEDAALRPDQVAELAEVAARVEAGRGKPERAGHWIRRALKETETAGEPRTFLRARLVAAGAAWDRNDFAAMTAFLEQARPALDDPDLAWRWHQLQALRVAEDPGGGPLAVESSVRALRAGRRRRRRREAAGLWNDLGLARARAGDLLGAERAFLHLLRLEAGCDGPRKTTLALFNIAEIRIRRGRLAGVAETLNRSQEANRRSGNLRGLALDLEVAARFELALGRPAAALDLCREAREVLQRGQTPPRALPALLAARALGWLGRRDEAAARLAAVPAAVLEELEPEERPAVRAHADDREGALREAAGTPFESLWTGLLASGVPPAGSWEALAILEPYRAARLVFDAETAVPGSAPVHWLRTAASVLRRAGAVWPAEVLEARDGGPWRVLASYLGRPPGDPEALAALLAGAGHPGAELSLTTADELRLLVPGPGGAAELAAELDGGRLAVRAAMADDALRAVFALALRDLGRSAAASSRIPGLPPAPPPAGGLVGESPALRAAQVRIARLAPGDLPVLIQGESGTGKELAARQLHRGSARAGGPFLAVNCAAFSETLLLADLFGHARGAFTGADRDRKGVFESAHGGTVFLDEIGDLPLAAQGLLLRAVQEGEVRRLGESEARRVNVRVLTATHRDLSQMVEEGTFRRDLYFRLRVGCVELPPLRDRGDDVLRLADHFLARLSDRSGTPAQLSSAARAALQAHPWPGNVRELQNVLALAVALAGDRSIEPEHLELPAAGAAPRGSYHRQLDDLRRRQVLEALERHPESFSAAARFLGVSRQTFSYYVRRFGIGKARR